MSTRARALMSVLGFAFALLAPSAGYAMENVSAAFG